MDELERLAEAESSLVRRLAEAFRPGPLTLVLHKKSITPDIVTAGLPTVAVHIPAHRVARRLIKLAQCPVAAPSANPFGRISPTTATRVASFLGDHVDVILDGGPCSMGVVSTILSLVDETRPVLLRPGAIPVEDIRRIIGDVVDVPAELVNFNNGIFLFSGKGQKGQVKIGSENAPVFTVSAWVFWL